MATKRCPFCAEEIQSEAIKCRFCNSMLSSGGVAAPPVAPPLHVAAGPAGRPHAGAGAGGADRVLFDGTPSWKAHFWAYVGAGAAILSGIGLVAYLLTKSVGVWYLGFLPTVAGIVWFLIEYLKRMNLHIRITTSHIDLERGILGKNLDTMQLWRVRDIEWQQGLWDRILGVATLLVISHDSTNPNLLLRGIPGDKRIFADLRDAIAINRQNRNVMGVID